MKKPNQPPANSALRAEWLILNVGEKQPMNDATEIIDREKQFWKGSVGYYDRWLARDVLMVFPAPVGILKRDAILAGVRSGIRWTSIEMTDISIYRVNGLMLAVAYHARARKPKSTSDYVALIGSVYVQEAEGWKLAFHQHTPVQLDKNAF
jgi:hypothetical protein